MFPLLQGVVNSHMMLLTSAVKTSKIFCADLQRFNDLLRFFLANHLRKSKLYVPLQPANEEAGCS